MKWNKTGIAAPATSFSGSSLCVSFVFAALRFARHIRRRLLFCFTHFIRIGAPPKKPKTSWASAASRWADPLRSPFVRCPPLPTAHTRSHPIQSDPLRSECIVHAKSRGWAFGITQPTWGSANKGLSSNNSGQPSIALPSTSTMAPTTSPPPKLAKFKSSSLDHEIYTANRRGTIATASSDWKALRGGVGGGAGGPGSVPNPSNGRSLHAGGPMTRAASTSSLASSTRTMTNYQEYKMDIINQVRTRNGWPVARSFAMDNLGII